MNAMKLTAVAFTALVALATFANCHNLPDFGKGPLHEDIQYFLDFIPMDDVAGIMLQYAADDAEFQQLLEYCETEDFSNLIKEIEAIPQFLLFVDYLQINGVDMYDLLNKMNKIIGIPRFHDSLFEAKKITGGVKGLFEDVKALVNYDDFIKGYVYKMRESNAFRGFVAHLKGEDQQKFVKALYSNAKFLQFREMIAKKGIDVVLIEDVIYVVLGIEFPVLENNQPIDAQQVADGNFDDEEAWKAVEYVHGEKFHNLVRQVEAMPEYQDLVKYLQNAGLETYKLIQQLHEFIGMEDYVPLSEVNLKQRSLVQARANKDGFNGLRDD